MPGVSLRECCPGQGRRAITLVPHFHLVVIRHDQVAANLGQVRLT